MFLFSLHVSPHHSLSSGFSGSQMSKLTCALLTSLVEELRPLNPTLNVLQCSFNVENKINILVPPVLGYNSQSGENRYTKTI